MALAGLLVLASLSSTVLSTIPLLEFKGDSHYDFGFMMGSKMTSLIQSRYSESTDLAALKQWYATAAGKATFESYKQLHEQQFPEYMDEIAGIAAGSGIDPDIVLLMNLDEELSYFVPSLRDPARRAKVS